MIVCDTLTLVGIRGYDKLKFKEQTVAQQSLAPFQQSLSFEDLRKGLTGNEELSKDEIDVVLELEEEFARRGNF